MILGVGLEHFHLANTLYGCFESEFRNPWPSCGNSSGMAYAPELSPLVSGSGDHMAVSLGNHA